MDSKQWGRVQHIFHEVADRPPALQQELVEHLSAGDEAIAAEVLRMIEAEREGASLLESDLETAASELIHPEPDSIPSQSFGPYTLISLLGEGGMGVVYLAERSDLGSQAAVKILRDSALSPMRRQRFALEQRTLAHLNHPSIARLYDADTLEDGTPFIVMEYVAGIPLNKYVEQQALAIDAILRLFRSVCEAVRYAHAQAIIHRDLKPSNILATADGQVKLLDFGIAKHLETAQGSDPKTLTAFQFMTIIYAAPEQIKGGIASIQTDVYSLGVILYELLAGRLPYDLSNQSPAQAERLLETASAKPPSEFGLNASLTRRVSEASWRELDTICLTAMHKDQRRRYQSVEALIRDLDHYLKGEPLEAHPDSIGYRASRFFGRNRRALILSTALSLAALMYAVFFLVRLERARQATAAEAARTLQIQRFMLNLFNGGDNQTGPSEDLRVVTLLDRGVTQARTLDQDPETQAELYQTLAGIYVNLGKFDRADPLLQSALEKQKTLYGPQSPQVAETMSSLGLLRLDQAHPEDAEKLTRAALDIDRKLLTSGDPKLAKAMWALGHVLDERGAYDEAIPLLQQAVALQSKDPQAAADLAMSTAELATANSYTGHYQLADSLYRKSLAIDERIYGTGHPRVADDLISLGQIAHSLGSETQAEDYYRRGLAIKQSWYGEKHPDTAFAMMALAQSLIYQKRYDDAAPLLERSLAIQKEIYGESHQRVAMAYNQIGLLELRRGKYEAAIQDFTRMKEINQAVFGPRHLLVGIAVLNIGQVYLEEKQYASARQSFQAALDLFRQTLPAGHPDIGIAAVKLGMTLVQDQKYREAEAPLLDGLHNLEKQSPQPVDRLTAARKDLVTVYEHLHQEDNAAEYRKPLSTPAAK